jgi:hypothetical protein
MKHIPIPIESLEWSEALLRLVGLTDSRTRRVLYRKNRVLLASRLPKKPVDEHHRDFPDAALRFVHGLLSIGDSLDAFYCLDQLEQEFNRLESKDFPRSPKWVAHHTTEHWIAYTRTLAPNGFRREAERLLHAAMRLRAYLFFYYRTMDEVEQDILRLVNESMRSPAIGLESDVSPSILYEFDRIAQHLNVREFPSLFYQLYPLYQRTASLDALADSYHLCGYPDEAETLKREIARRRAMHGASDVDRNAPHAHEAEETR